MTRNWREPGPEQRIRPQIQDLETENIAELARRASALEDVIPLWYGESDLVAPAVIRDAAKHALDAGRTFYVADMRGNAELVDALAAYQTRLHGREIGTDRTTVTPGGMQSVLIALQLLVDAGTNVVYAEPQWPNIRNAIHLVGGEPRPVAMTFDLQRGWRLDLERLFQRCDARTRAIMLSTPSNPLGWTASHDELRALLEFSRARGIWIICDEVYARLYFDNAVAPSMMQLTQPDDLVLCINSFSKAWAMTGFRIGWINHPPAVAQKVAALTQYMNSGVADFVQAAAVAALTQGEPFVETMRQRCLQGVTRAYDTLGSVGRVQLPPRPRGGMYVFFRVEGWPDSRKASLELVERARVGLSPGDLFGASGAGFLRMCIARNPEALDKALQRLVAGIGQAQGRIPRQFDSAMTSGVV